jgi:cell wall-associated NlpC family hydrolase
VAFSDPSLRAAVASQLVDQGVIAPGSDGTTVTASDMLALKTLSVADQGIVRLDGLQYAANLTSLDLGGNEIATITPLAGLTNLTELDASSNELDLALGSPAMAVISALKGCGAHVAYQPQRTELSRPFVPVSAAKYGTSVTFTASLAPQAALTSGTAELHLYHLETKIVTKKTGGVYRRVRVNYWRLHSTLAMRAYSAKGLSVAYKLPHAGKWQAQVTYAGSADYEPCDSTVSAFVVRDPRIEAAISWAKRRLGSHRWDHYCTRFVSDCYERGAGATVYRYRTAKQAADALHAAAHPGTNPPRGALVFHHSWHGRTDLGHVGISLGNGTMINDFGDAGVKIISIHHMSGYIGWAAPPVSPPIIDWNQPTAR